MEDGTLRRGEILPGRSLPVKSKRGVSSIENPRGLGRVFWDLDLDFSFMVTVERREGAGRGAVEAWRCGRDRWLEKREERGREGTKVVDVMVREVALFGRCCLAGDGWDEKSIVEDFRRC